MISLTDSFLPQDLFLVISAPDDHIKNILQKTCRFFHNKLSRRKPTFELIAHPYFVTNEKNMLTLA